MRIPVHFRFLRQTTPLHRLSGLRRGRSVFFMLPAVFATICVASAPPAIESVLPRGGQRGTDVVVTFRGARLEAPLEVLSHEPGVTCVAVEAVEPGVARATLRLAPDGAPGLRFLRLRTAAGISNGRLFSVGALPEIAEAEPNQTSQTAQAITLPVCINGAIPPEDVDVFSFAGAAGQVVSVEIEGQRLGDVLFDPRFALTDSSGAELAVADDSSLLRQDAALTATLPAEGTYCVVVRETAFGGAGNAHYRLHVGSFPRPAASHPCGGQAGSTAPVTWIGGGGSTQSVTFSAESGFARVPAIDERGISPSPIPFRVSELGVAVEVEPNDSPEQATPLTLPGAASGVISAAREVDYFVFDGAQGQTLEARLFARRLGSPLDAVVEVRRLTGGEGAGNDDAAGADSVLRWTCQASEKYVIAVRDLLWRGGGEFVYFLEIGPPKPALTLTVSSREGGLTVPAGNRAALLVTANRVDFGGALNLAAEGLPGGVSAHFVQMPASVGQIPVVFEAVADAAPAGALVDLTATHVDAATGPRGRFHQDIELVRYENNPFYSYSVDRLAVASAQPAPFRIELRPPDTPIVRFGSMSLPVRVERAEGYEGHITARMIWNPPGIASGALELPSGTAEGGIPLNAAGNAAVGRWPIVVIASADGGGAPIEVSSGLVELEVADPFVEFAVERTRTEQGKPVELVVKLTHRAPFEGEAQAQLLGLPNKVKTVPLNFTAQTSELRFPLNVESDAPPGEHGSVFVHVPVPTGSAAVAHNSPPGQLVIDRPLPPKDPQKEAERAEAARKAQEEKDRRKAERLAAIEARRKETEARKDAEPPTPSPQP